MTITLEALKLHLNLTGDEDFDDALLTDKLAVATAMVDRNLGFVMADTYGGVDQDPLPAPLAEAVYMLAAHFYEHREAVVIGSGPMEVPFGVREIVNSYRDWTV